MKIINYISDFSQITGVQKVMIDINMALKEKFDIICASPTPFENIPTIFNLNKDEYTQIINLKNIPNNSVVILHERRVVLKLSFINKILRKNLKIIYVHHSEMHNYKMIPIFADKIVAISDSGRKNLIQDLNVPESKITKIHNCVQDNNNLTTYKPISYPIKVAMIGKIYNVKQQVEIVKHLKGRIPSSIIVDFIGEGPDSLELQEEIKNDNNFRYRGFLPDIKKELENYDFLLLFSKHEGLPITLIEGTLCARPLISNSVGGCPEIVFDKYNGFVANTWEELIKIFNDISNLSDDQMQRLSINSRKVYEKYFSVDIFKQKYVNLINQII